MNPTLTTNSNLLSDEEAKVEIDRLFGEMQTTLKLIEVDHERTRRSRERTKAMLQSIEKQLGDLSRVAKAD